MEQCPKCEFKGFAGMMKMHVWKHWSAATSTSLANWVDGVEHQSSKYDVAFAFTAEQFEGWVAGSPSVQDLTFALIWNVRMDKQDLCDLIIKAGGNVNLREERLNDTTAMRMATVVGEDLARYIFLKGGNAKEQGCILTAGLYGHFELVKLLVMAGADFSSPVNGETPIQAILARGEQNKTQIVKFLQEEAPALAALCAGHKHTHTKPEPKAEGTTDVKAAAPTTTDAKPEVKDAPRSTDDAPTAPPKSAKRVMISYQWDCQPVVRRLADSLKTAGYNVWLDLEQMTGSTLTAMAEAVEGSEVVVVALSSKYQNSKNCRLEGEYAHLNSKTIVPLMMESNFRPTGWLGLIIGGRLWFDFTAEDRHASSYQGLVGELQRSLGPPSTPSVIASPPPPPPPAVDKFADFNVYAFLKTNNITTRIQLDGACMSELAKMRAKEGSSVAFVNFLLTHITQLDAPSALRLSNALAKLGP
jgi:hypothetical protein